MSGEPKTLTPQRFRRKDDALSVIEAIQWTGRNTGAVMEWVGEHRNHSTGGMELTFVPLGYPVPELWVEQRGAWVTVRPGDWFIQAAVGFYPCKPDIFAATYEPVGVRVVARDEAPKALTHSVDIDLRGVTKLKSVTPEPSDQGVVNGETAIFRFRVKDDER